MIDIEKIFPRVAIVMDQMISFGGADRELYSLLKIIPHADIFTILFVKEKYPNLKNKVYTSFFQKISKFLPKNFYRHLKIFTPIVYENFNLEGYDLVISISAGPGKGIITGLDQPHLARVLTPPRNLWDGELNVRGSSLKGIYKPISSFLNTYMRMWDFSTAKRVDYWCANSNFIARKIKRTYREDSKVIYPGVEKKYYEDTPKYKLKEVMKKYSLPKDFVLVVSRLYDYKKVDLAIRACIKAKKELMIIGEGPDKKYLQKIAKGNTNIHFIGRIPDDEVIAFYKLSQVFLFCGIEDFGLTPVESMASGTPVLAYGYGGALETIVPGITGEFFMTEEDLYSLLINFSKKIYNTEEIKKHSLNFSEEKYLNNFETYITEIYDKEIQRKNQ